MIALNRDQHPMPNALALHLIKLRHEELTCMLCFHVLESWREGIYIMNAKSLISPHLICCGFCHLHATRVVSVFWRLNNTSTVARKDIYKSTRPTHFSVGGWLVGRTTGEPHARTVFEPSCRKFTGDAEDSETIGCSTVAIIFWICVGALSHVDDARSLASASYSGRAGGSSSALPSMTIVSARTPS
jgi:hypothetical protein